jgi:hypothetical protein
MLLRCRRSLPTENARVPAPVIGDANRCANGDRLEDLGEGLASGLFNTSQQIGGALGLAVLSTLATSRMHAAGGVSTDALVVGFHWAFGIGAVAMLAALAVLVALLRRHHVARIEEQAASGELALAAA